MKEKIKTIIAILMILLVTVAGFVLDMNDKTLEYLKDHDLADSENYKRAEECIRQGREYRSDDTPHNGISPVREAYMTSNFIDEYSSVGGKIMGIYGGYHTQLNNPDMRIADPWDRAYRDTYGSQGIMK